MSTAAPPARAEYRAGSLTYNAAGLRRVFGWLLAGEVVFTLIDLLEPKVLPVLLKGWRHVLAVPGLGPVVLGPCRLVNLLLGALYGLAWFGLLQVRRHWQKLGGPHAYRPPL